MTLRRKSEGCAVWSEWRRSRKAEERSSNDVADVVDRDGVDRDEEEGLLEWRTDDVAGVSLM